MQPDIHHRLPAGMGQVRKLLDALRAELHDAQVPTELNDATQIIMAEVLNNVVEHAYRFSGGRPMEVSIWLRPDGIACEVCDDGEPMPWGQLPAGVMPPIDANASHGLPEGGFGWALVRDLTRDVEYARTNGRNHLRFFVPADAAESAE